MAKSYIFTFLYLYLNVSAKYKTSNLFSPDFRLALFVVAIR